MAVSKILHIGDCGAGYAGKHLRQALDYIAAPEKTGGGRFVGFLNCRPEQVYEQMRRTKEQFGKTDKRQGYHIIISFPEWEADARTAFEVIRRFAESYLGKGYEAMYAVHDNTDHIHGHIIFNSVSFRDGRKYRYKKGDWEKEIQPLVDRFCEERGFQTLEMSRGAGRAKPRGERNAGQDGKRVSDKRRVWEDMIRRDIDAAILRAATYESFLSVLSGMGYGVKNAYRTEGKYLSVMPMGMDGFRRCKSLGEDYTEERIRERILREKAPSCGMAAKRREPRIVYCRVKRQKREKLTGIQKRYFVRLYRAGLLKKRPYSRAWQYRDEIREMGRLKEEYLFLVKNHITTAEGVRQAAAGTAAKRKEAVKEKTRIFQARARMKPLFDMADELAGLQECENCFQRGDPLFGEEHSRYAELSGELEKEGYTAGQVMELKAYYQSEAAKAREKEKAAAKEEKTAARILAWMETEKAAKRAGERQEEEKRQETEKRREEEKREDRQEDKAGGRRETGRPRGR